MYRLFSIKCIIKNLQQFVNNLNQDNTNLNNFNNIIKLTKYKINLRDVEFLTKYLVLNSVLAYTILLKKINAVYKNFSKHTPVNTLYLNFFRKQLFLNYNSLLISNGLVLIKNHITAKKFRRKKKAYLLSIIFFNKFIQLKKWGINFINIKGFKKNITFFTLKTLFLNNNAVLRNNVNLLYSINMPYNTLLNISKIRRIKKKIKKKIYSI